VHTVHPNLQRGRIVVEGGGGGRIGDVDCDGDIDAIDAALLLQRSAGLLMTLRCQQNADTNGDGSVNSIDAALVLQLVAGYLDSLPP
jgi:oligosaccharide reducing-end xylanase